MKILITGGAGFIGSHLVNFLLDQHVEVINIDKLTYAGNLLNLKDASNNPNYCFYKVDICNSAEIKKLIFQHQPDAILHLAAESHVDRSIDCAEDFIQTNILGTYSLLNAAYLYFKAMTPSKQKFFRFLHLSTDEVFGALGFEGRFSEESSYRPNSPYAASKASSDLIVRSYHHTYGFPSIIANSSNNYGPQQYPEKLIPLTILNALEHKPLPIYGEGKQIRDWLYVGDHVKALWQILKQGHVGEQYCIGANNECTNFNFVERICDVLDKFKPSTSLKTYRELIRFTKDRPGHDFRYAIDASKLRNHTGWEPQVSFEEGIAFTVQWYIEKAQELRQDNARNRRGLG